MARIASRFDMERSAIRNGRVIPEREAVVPVTLRAVQYSFSIYEALRVLHGQVVHLEDHLNRLRASAAAIGLVHPFTDKLIGDSIAALIKADSISDATMRILVVGGDEPLFFITYQDLLSYPDSYYSDGISCISFKGERYLPEAKTSNLLMQYIALEEARKAGAFEALLEDREGYLLEGTRSNLYAIKGDVVHTAADDRVLSGITRISVLRAAKELGLSVSHEPIARKDMLSYDSIFISATSMGAMPVNAIDGIALGRSRWDDISRICSLVRKWELE